MYFPDDPLHALDPIFNAVPEGARCRLIAAYDHEVTEAEWALGYRFDKFTVAVLGSNLGDRRDAVQLSELGEGQFYRLPAHRVDATVTWHYK